MCGLDFLGHSMIAKGDCAGGNGGLHAAPRPLMGPQPYNPAILPDMYTPAILPGLSNLAGSVATGPAGQPVASHPPPQIRPHTGRGSMAQPVGLAAQNSFPAMNQQPLMQVQPPVPLPGGLPNPVLHGVRRYNRTKAIIYPEDLSHAPSAKVP